MRINMKKFTAVVALSICGFASSPAFAGTETGSMTVSATVEAACLMTTAPLAFGSYTGLAISGTANFSISCTNSTPYTLALNAGSSTGATVSTRKMTSTGGTLAYALYRDSARTLNWGTDVGTTYSGTGSGSAQSVSIYGSVASGQQPTPGSYSDVVTATLTY